MNASLPLSAARLPAGLRNTAAACVCALWLAWSVPAWLAVNRPAPPPVDEQGVLQRLQRAAVLPDRAAMLIAQDAAPCACGDTAVLAASAAAAGLAVMPLPAALMPYPIVVLNDKRRVVYAGGSTLDRQCSNDGGPAWPVISRLLDLPSGRPLFTAPCSC